MIRNDVELHNVASVAEREDGILLERTPGEVRERLNEKACGNYTRPTGAEVRFCPDGSTVAFDADLADEDANVFLADVPEDFESLPANEEPR